MNYAFRLSFFGVALGFVLAFKLFGSFLPINIGVSFFMGLFWPYLTRGQNLSIGGFRLLMYLPIVSRRIFRSYTEAKVLVDFYSWMYGITGIVVPDSGSILAYNEMIRYILVGIEVVVPLIVCFGFPYFCYRLYRWRGVFERMPWGGVV